jgi:hypothetical protein
MQVERGNSRNLEKVALRIKSRGATGRACSTYGRYDKLVQNFNVELHREEATLEIDERMNEA